MHDPFPSVWADVLAKLPRPEPLVLHPKPNTDAEHLSCCLCGLGSDMSYQPTEWVVTFRTSRATVTQGLHEACRSKHAGSRYSQKSP
jgi:hypothetical protein